MAGKVRSIYPKNRSHRLDLSLFRHPTSEYRGTPFWSWNDVLDIAQLKRQVEQLRQMGFGGFHVHSRTGLADEYLGKKYLRALRECTKLAAKKGMLSWLYDEDRWPSGSAGGIVTRDKEYRIKHLLWTRTPYRTDGTRPPLQDRNSGTRSEDGRLLASYEVTLKDGYLAHYRRVDNIPRSVGFPPTNESPQSWAERPRYFFAYCESPQESTWFNGQTYVDTLSRKAIERFIEVTHDALKRELGDYFGGIVPAIFTDEPQFTKKTTFVNPEDHNDLFMPWTEDFPATFAEQFDFDLLDSLPELFWNLKDDAPSRTRWCYHDHVAERFADAFGDTIGKWCQKNGIALTGHMLGEATLAGQSRGVGEAMRGLRSFHIPGIDILCDKMEFTTAKQAQSIARQYDRPGVLSELYGVTNWDYDFVGHKAQGDWQAALGVTVRVPHLTWQSMRGEAKRDYPASIGYQSPWYREYPLIEDHFARLNTVLTRGKPVVRVALIHPIESTWLATGPTQHNGAELAELEERFQSLTQWLLKAQIDFDFVSEALLPSQSDVRKEKSLKVGAMRYDVVIVPSLRTIRSTTLQRLSAFASEGGAVICAGRVPDLVDAKPSTGATDLAKKAMVVPFERTSILRALQPWCDLTIVEKDGSAADTILYQLREDHGSRYLFLCNLDRVSPRNQLSVKLNGRWSPTLLDTMTGKTSKIPARQESGVTTITLDLSAHGHALLSLERGKADEVRATTSPNWKQIGRLASPSSIELSEPNVLLLDRATWRIGDGRWQKDEEILRIDDLVRKQLGLPLRGPRVAQPWADASPSPVVSTVQLKFSIDSRVAIRSPRLALEDRNQTTIHLDGRKVNARKSGWWVDECIDVVSLPSFQPGQHELLLTIPMTRRTNLEWCYLLGDFGVRVAGSRARLVDPVQTIGYGDWVHQGLPFFAGNVTYHCEIKGDGRNLALDIPRFKSPLLSIGLDGKCIGKIAFAPYRLELGRLKGKHRLSITAYGNRANAFGPVHNAIENLSWVGPGAWRSDGNAWADEYQLKRVGLLTAPLILAAE
jgi:hypothetical protein